MQAPPDYRELEDQIATTRKEKEAAIEAQQFERAAKLRDDEKALLEQRETKETEWRAGGAAPFHKGTEGGIAGGGGRGAGTPASKPPPGGTPPRPPPRGARPKGATARGPPRKG